MIYTNNSDLEGRIQYMCSKVLKITAYHFDEGIKSIKQLFIVNYLKKIPHTQHE